MHKLLLLSISVIFPILAESQVTIGSNLPPAPGALLDLKTNGEMSIKGLGLPRVELQSIRTQTDLGKTMGAVESETLDPLTHIGLIVYNVGKNEESEEARFCPGLHIWDGDSWQSLTPYSGIKVGKFLVLNSYRRGFEYLNPGFSAGWPEEKEVSRAAGRYNLGQNITVSPSPNGTDNIVDLRPNESTANTYAVSRFYVGYRLEMEDYEIKKSYLCDFEAAPQWDEANKKLVTDTTRIFDDGIWMTQNLRTTRLHNGTSLLLRSNSNYDHEKNDILQYYIPGAAYNTLPQIDNNSGVLYNWAGALALGTNKGPSSLPGVSEIVDQGGSTNKDVTYQGICPDGWHLPSDQEWTDLANGIAKNVSNTASTVFADMLSGQATTIGYDVNDTPTVTTGSGGYLGQAMKTQTKLSASHSVTNGKSKARTNGGFDVYLTGSSSGYNASDNADVSAIYYGQNAYFWTSSAHPYRAGNSTAKRIYAYHVWFRNDLGTPADHNFYKGNHLAIQTFSVRCKKMTE